MNKYRIRFNHSRGVKGRGTPDHIWRVFEGDQEYLFKHFEINVPTRSEKDPDSENWNLVCEGVLTIDKDNSIARIDSSQQVRTK
jgi:hypothetical protein